MMYMLIHTPPPDGFPALTHPQESILRPPPTRCHVYELNENTNFNINRQFTCYITELLKTNSISLILRPSILSNDTVPAVKQFQENERQGIRLSTLKNAVHLVLLAH